MKNKKIIILIICILVVILFIVGLYFYGLSSVSNKSDIVKFTIEPGTSTREVINDLYDAKIIKSKISSLIYVKLQSNYTIKAGTYELDRKDSTRDIFEIIGEGKVVDDTITITFIEGKRVTDYISLISEKFGYSESEIKNVINDSEYIRELLNEYDFLSEKNLNSDLYYTLEGYLFPSTYEFYKDASIKTILEKMLDKTENVLDNYSTSLKESDYDIHEILTMASIIENETMIAEQRDEVSQVIYKRLDINMSLGMDVTTYYGVQKSLKEELTQSDLNDKNAYNTRDITFKGLPVGPICNPSEASIKAALNPNTETDYLYFYADKTGELHFAKTNSEFQNLIQKYS